MLTFSGTSIGSRPADTSTIISTRRVTSVSTSGSIDSSYTTAISPILGSTSATSNFSSLASSCSMASSKGTSITSGISKCSGPLETTISTVVSFFTLLSGPGSVEITYPAGTSSSKASDCADCRLCSASTVVADFAGALTTLGTVVNEPGPWKKYHHVPPPRRSRIGNVIQSQSSERFLLRR